MSDLTGRIALVTGAASGIGAATAQLLRRRGATVIGADIREADIAADLSTPDGRAQLCAQAARMAPDGLDMLIAAAGVAHGPPGLATAVNYFGVVATLEGLRPLLARRGGSAVAICSTAGMHDAIIPLLDACRAGDEERAMAVARAEPDQREYATSKRALALWLRQAATRADWAGSNICLNAIAPGLTLTPMTIPLLADPEMATVVGPCCQQGRDGG